MLITFSCWYFYWTVNNNGNNSSGFTALPGGFRYVDGIYYYINANGYWWSSSESASNSAWMRDLVHDHSTVTRSMFGYMKVGYSVRCIKNTITTKVVSETTSTLKIFPNPVTGLLTIKNISENNPIISINIFDSQGRLLVIGKAFLPMQQIDFSKFSPGLYILEFIRSSGESQHVKIMKY